MTAHNLSLRLKKHRFPQLPKDLDLKNKNFNSMKFVINGKLNNVQSQIDKLRFKQANTQSSLKKQIMEQSELLPQVTPVNLYHGNNGPYGYVIEKSRRKRNTNQ